MSNNKMKGLLKGLRYISQIFDNEKEPEMQIGYPTDVKHVAHIGWDGPSVNSPSWMGEFKSAGNSFSSSSAPLNSRGEPQDENSIHWISEDKANGRITRSRGLDGDAAELPRSSRRHSTSGGLATDSPTKDKIERQKQRRSKDKDGRSSRLKDSTESSSNPPTLPKSRRKKSVSKSSRSKHANASDVDCGSDCGSVSNCGSNLSALEDDAENGYTGIS